MVCKVADNPPLQKLRDDLGFKSICHSFRENCIHRLEKPSNKHNLGGIGSAIGYCQALFNKSGNPQKNTLDVIHNLNDIGAPWSKSHELFWGNKGDVAIHDYVTEASLPLIGDGRVPILITGLHAIKDSEEIKKILSSPTLVVPGETILLRIIIDDIVSAKLAINYMESLIDNAIKNNLMPQWWPLLQGSLTLREWSEVQLACPNLWKYFNIATTPWIDRTVYDFIKDQVTVAQVPVGLEEGIFKNGTLKMIDNHIELPDVPKCSASYNLFTYFELFNGATSAPTIIVLGPSKAEWSIETNKARIKALLPLLEEGCKILWGGLSKSDYETVLAFTA